MKYFALVFALGCSGSALAVGLDFSMSANMYYESHGYSPDFGSWNDYFNRFAEWQNETRRETLSWDHLETAYGSNRFSYHAFSEGESWSDRYSGSYGYRFGNGTLQGSFSIQTAGDYFIDASVDRGGAGYDGPVWNRLTQGDGTVIFELSDTGTFHSSQFLAAGTYFFNARYHSRTDSPYGPSSQHIRLSVQAVPEPGTMLAFGAGLACFARKRKLAQKT